MVCHDPFPYSITQSDFIEAIASVASSFTVLQMSGEHLLSHGGQEWTEVDSRAISVSSDLIGKDGTPSSLPGPYELTISVRFRIPMAHQPSGNPPQLDPFVDEEITEVDDDCLRVLSTGGSQELVKYSVVLSPTYCVPVLYFWAYDRQRHSPMPVSLDNLQKYLPLSTSSPADSCGVIGSVSICCHPIHDFPVYFVHPCNTSQGLSAFSEHFSGPNYREKYILTWLGLVGPAVGLTVPVALAMALLREKMDKNNGKSSISGIPSSALAT